MARKFGAVLNLVVWWSAITTTIISMKAHKRIARKHLYSHCMSSNYAKHIIYYGNIRQALYVPRQQRTEQRT